MDEVYDVIYEGTAAVQNLTAAGSVGGDVDELGLVDINEAVDDVPEDDEGLDNEDDEDDFLEDEEGVEEKHSVPVKTAVCAATVRFVNRKAQRAKVSVRGRAVRKITK